MIVVVKKNPKVMTIGNFSKSFFSVLGFEKLIYLKREVL